MIDYVAIGRRIKMYRLKAKITQATLAERLDVSDKYISAVERGATKVSLDRIDEIATLLNITLINILSDCDTSSPTYGDSEIIELIKEWNPNQKATLICVITSINKTNNH